MRYHVRLTLPSRQLGNTETHMVKIRLTRGGRNIERVGFYNPVASGNDKPVELDVERVKYWVDNGAQMTDKVANLYKQAAKAAAAEAPAA